MAKILVRDIVICEPEFRGKVPLLAKVYDSLLHTDITKALLPEQNEANIGLDAIALLLEELLKSAKPDVIYLETSLFPDRTRLNETLKDFLFVKTNSRKENSKKTLSEILNGYRLVYLAFHETGNTIYYVPRFFIKPTRMEMTFTEFTNDTTFFDEGEREIVKIKTKQIQEKIEEIQKRKFKNGEWIKCSDENYVRASELTRAPGPSQEQDGEKELAINTCLFHSFFHQYAFPSYRKSWLWCIPVVGAGEGFRTERSLMGQGAIFVLAAYKEKENILLNDEQASQIGRLISYLVKDLFSSYLYISAKDMLAETFRHALRSAIAAIMARNMSHNIGSHVLASTELLKGIHRDEIQKLHNFLQQRMDFIAQVVTYTPSWGEPIFFFNDLLQGFLDQYLLLGHLIKDQGYSDITVVVHINGKEWNFKRDERQRCENEDCGHPTEEGSGEKICQCENKKTTRTGRWLLQPNSNSLNDFLVAIPGGAIGVHAFYDIIENNMRNSAKYGKKTDAKGRLCGAFELHIRIVEEDERYRITLWDNLSRRDEGEHSDEPACSCCVCKVQRSLEEELISPATGEVVAQSRGVHEMKECARILVYPYEQWGFQRGGKSYSLGIDGMMYEGQEYLSLQFYLQKPRLVGIVSAIARNEMEAKRSGVFQYENLQELTNHAHQFGLILMPENAKEQQKALDFIARHHHLLSYRLLLVANDRIEYEDLKIPKRRVYWCTPNEIIWPQDDSEQGWLNFVIRIYELWVQKFKITMNGDKWQLLIAFEREENHPAFMRWQKGLEDFDSPVIDVHVIRTDMDKKNPVVMASTRHLKSDNLTALVTQNPEKWILFDNHGQGKGLLSVNKSKLQFYQDFGISTLKLHQALESPPSPGFGFKFFVLGLVESTLTSVLIIDERVAEATFDQDKGFTQGLLVNLREAKCYPAYSVWTKNQQAKERTFISDAIQRHDESVRKSSGINIHDEEGAYLDFSDSSVKVQRFYRGMLKTDVEEKSQFDFIIIHQGVIDRLNNLNRWIKDKYIPRLEEISPSIVVTSGRGHTLRHVPEALPFLEFSIIRENTYMGMSKYHIVRALFSVSGKRP